MTKGVLGRIDDIRTELVSLAQSGNFDQILQGGLALEDSLSGTMSQLQLLLSLQSFDLMPKTQLLDEKRSTGLYRKVDHYSSNILPLLMLIVNMMDEYRQSRRKFSDRDFIRIRLDIEKLFSDVRSFLDALYKWLICYQPNSPIPTSRRAVLKWGAR